MPVRLIFSGPLRLCVQPSSQDRLQSPPYGRRRKSHLLDDRCVEAGRQLGDARRAEPGRADESPGRRKRRVAGAPPAAVRRHRDRGDPRSVLPRQRRDLDPRDRLRQVHPLEGQLLHLAGEQGQADGDRRAAGQEPPKGPRTGTGVDSAIAQGPPGQEQGPHRQLRPHGAGERAEGDRRTRHLHPARPAARAKGRRGQRPDQGLRRQAADGQG